MSTAVWSAFSEAGGAGSGQGCWRSPEVPARTLGLAHSLSIGTLLLCRDRSRMNALTALSLGSIPQSLQEMPPHQKKRCGPSTPTHRESTSSQEASPSVTCPDIQKCRHTDQKPPLLRHPHIRWIMGKVGPPTHTPQVSSFLSLKWLLPLPAQHANSSWASKLMGVFVPPTLSLSPCLLVWAGLHLCPIGPLRVGQCLFSL